MSQAATAAPELLPSLQWLNAEPQAIAGHRGLSLNKLIEEIDGQRSRDAKPSNLSSAIRVFVLDQLLTERTSTPSLPRTAVP